MNLDFIRGDFRFNARVSALIYNDEQNKVLLFNVEGRDFYMLPGGRIEELEVILCQKQIMLMDMKEKRQLIA